MKLKLIVGLGVMLCGAIVQQTTAQTGSYKLDRTKLPIDEPDYPHSTILDARDAKPPPRFKIEAPTGAPNVLIVLVDDIGFGVPSAFGGPVRMATADRLASQGLRYNHSTRLRSVRPRGRRCSPAVTIT